MAASLALALKADLSDALDGHRILAASVGVSGEAVVLAALGGDAAVALGRHEQAGWASFPRSQSERPYAATVLVHDGHGVRQTYLEDIGLAHTYVQVLPGPEILVVGARCSYSARTGPERNAAVYDADGHLRRQFVLGDGIKDVQTTALGDIWVSYFDEGVYGNYGWGTESGPEPMGAAGLVRYSGQGERLWTFPGGQDAPSVDDCYALDVAPDAVWAYYYSDFPLVRIGPDGAVRVFRTGVAGASAIAVADSEVLFFGSYPLHRGRSLVGRIGDGRVTDLESVAVELPSGAALGNAVAVGRGSTLNVFHRARWYQADVRDVTRRQSRPRFWPFGR